MTGSLDDVKRRILARVNLADLIGERVKLTLRAGLVGCCPFHAEKTPSFYVYDDGRYHCFGCKADGDAIEFVRKMEGLSFPETLRFLAGKYGIEAPELDESRGRLNQQRTDASLYKLMVDAQEFFVSGLMGDGGAGAREYLKKRGFEDANIAAFGFGLTPPEGFGLTKYLRSKGYRDQQMVDCSLGTASTRDGRAFDFFRQRLTIPIRDPQGRLIAFGGRALGDEQPKYKNSTNTKLFDKSHTLFGLGDARRSMRDKGRAIVVEGYMDALQLWQQGYPEAVACLGTAFTEAHLKLLKHATGLVILLFDGDGAGRKATLGAINVALTAPEVQLRAVTLPNNMDPDDFVRASGCVALESLIAKAEPLLDFVINERLRSTEALGIPDLLTHEFIPWLAKIPDRMQRDFLVHRIAQKTGVPVDHLASQLRNIPAAAGQQLPDTHRRLHRSPTESAKTLLATLLTPAAFDLLGHLYWSSPKELNLEGLGEVIAKDLELGPDLLEFVAEMTAVLNQGTAPASRGIGAWASGLSPEVLALLEKLTVAESAFACQDRPLRIEKLLSHLRAARTKATISALKTQVARLAGLPEAADEMAQLLKTINELNKPGTPAPPPGQSSPSR